MKTENPKQINSILIPGFLRTNKYVLYFWNDSVLNQIVIAAIFFLIPFLFSAFKALFCNMGLLESILEVATFKVSLYLIIIVLVLYQVINLFLRRTMKKKRDLNKLYKTKIGNSTFAELYNTMLNHMIKTPDEYKDSNIDSASIVKFLVIFYRKYIPGIPDDLHGDIGGFLFWRLGAILSTYELVEIITDNENKQLMFLSPDGKLFIQTFFKLQNLQKKEYKEW